jgi:N-methylhydantoinase B
MTSHPNALDPIAVEVLHNALLSVTEEAYVALMRSAYSTNIKERHDHSVMLTGADGRLVAQPAQSLPIHLASMLGLVKSILARYSASQIHQGDLFVGNDPYVAGGTHLPDINLAMPVFAGGRLIAWICNIAHHADIGGMAAGGLAAAMTEIYQEGLRIPPIKLGTNGELNQDLLDLLLLNARVPDERRGDYFAQISSCRLGERRLRELIDRYTADFMLAGFDEIISRTAKRMRASIRRLRPGHYFAEDVLDDDAHGEHDIPIKLQVVVEGDRVCLDFRGSAPQVRGNINMTFNTTQSVACYTLKALLDEDVPNNQGVLDSIEITCDENSLLNCSFPAAVALRTAPCQRIADMIIGALQDAVPDFTCGASNGSNTSAIFTGLDPRTQRRYLYLETLGGGFGGRATKDGKDGVQVHITNTSNLPVEAIESEYPLLVECYELVADSAGAGKHRGGAGLRRVVRPVGHIATFTGFMERVSHRPWGVFGGAEGGSGRFYVVNQDGSQEPLSGKPYEVRFGPDQCVAIETPGAGGYGPPRDRSLDEVAADARSGLFSAQYLTQHYGWPSIDPEEGSRPCTDTASDRGLTNGRLAPKPITDQEPWPAAGA